MNIVYDALPVTVIPGESSLPVMPSRDARRSGYGVPVQ